jgi:hypothetical protein
MLNEEKLDLIVSQLVENIESRITFYSDEDREFFVENVVRIILLSEQDQVEYNLYCFLEHNYENYTALQHNLNEGIGGFVSSIGSAVKGVAKGIGRALGFGKPAEKIAFGAPPTTTVSAPISKDRDGGGGKDGKGGGGKESTEKSDHEKYVELIRAAREGGTTVNNTNDLRGAGASGQVDASTGRTTTTIKTGDVMSGNAAKAGRDLTQQDVSGNAQAQAGNVEDNRQQSVTSPAGDSQTSSTVAQPNTQGQKAAAQAKQTKSGGKYKNYQHFLDLHGGDEEKARKDHAAYRAPANKRRADARAAAANQGTQTTKQTATTDTKGAAGGDSKVGNVDFGSGPRGHTMGARTTTTQATPAPAKPEKNTNRSKSGRSSRSAPEAKPATEPSNIGDSVDMSVLYADYMNRFLKG